MQNMASTNDLENQVAIITGAGGDIGQGIALELAKSGANITIIDIENLDSKYHQAGSEDLGGYEASKTVVDEIEDLGREAISIECDISNNNQVEAMIDSVLDEFGKFDILVNNVGMITHAPIEEMDEEEWDSIMDVNAKGVFLCSRAAIPHMVDRQAGTIINTASVAGKIPFSGLGHYCASKFANIGLMKVLALELASDNITVNAICPGIVRTPMWDDVLTPSQGESYEETIEDLMPLGRDQTPEDTGQLAVYFATNPNVTGQAVNVDGGMTINVVR